jgi:hypothetical protein
MRPTHLVPLAGATFALFLLPTLAQPPGPPKPAKLPLTRIVLFNSGVGYFHREGTVDGTARVELKVDAEDVNDLIKSLIAADKDGGMVRSVMYDNRAPAEVTLKAFAVDFTENPSVGQLLHQVRGEKVEVTDKSGAVVAGSIVSVDRPGPQVLTVPGVDADGDPLPRGKPITVWPKADATEDVLLLTADGLQPVSLKAAKKIRFLKPELQTEFHKALEALAAARGEARKQVGVEFAGIGQRRVSVGYVTEAPVWKPSYRLTLDGPATGKFEGWAAVENTTDEDWENVKVALVSGRPMTFRMDLYDPLFVPRPLVEPEVYASLRPPIYQAGQAPGQPMGAFGFQGGIGGIGSGIGGGIGGGIAGIGGFQGGFGQLGQFGNLGGQFGLQGGSFPYGLSRPTVRSLLQNKITFEEFSRRTRVEEELEIKPRKPNPMAEVFSAAAATTLVEPFEYAVPDPVTLPRFKSALLPIANAAVDASRVSVYNRAVLERYPLAGVKFVNKTGRHLAAGPMAVYVGDTFAGDARIPALKPNDTRLVSYAIDLHVTANYSSGGITSTTDAVKLGPIGILVESTYRMATTYTFRNAATAPRTVLVEHPVTGDWRVVGPVQPAERTRSFTRFEVAVKEAGTATLTVSEERKDAVAFALNTATIEQLDGWLASPVVTAAARAAITRAKADRTAIAGYADTINVERSALKAIAEEQTRIRANIERVPRDSDAYKRYLKKFDDQETEIERRQAKVTEVQAALDTCKKAFEEFVNGLKAE